MKSKACYWINYQICFTPEKSAWYLLFIIKLKWIFLTHASIYIHRCCLLNYSNIKNLRWIKYNHTQEDFTKSPYITRVQKHFHVIVGKYGKNVVFGIYLFFYIFHVTSPIKMINLWWQFNTRRFSPIFLLITFPLDVL